MSEVIPVRFLRAKEKGCSPAKFVGKGTLQVQKTDLVLDGKKPFPLIAQVAIFFGIGFVVMAIGFGPSGFLLALLIDFFARSAHSMNIPVGSVQSVVKEDSSARLAVTANTGDRRPVCVAFQSQQFSALVQVLQERFPSVIRDGKVKGTRTF